MLCQPMFKRTTATPRASLTGCIPVSTIILVIEFLQNGINGKRKNGNANA